MYNKNTKEMAVLFQSFQRGSVCVWGSERKRDRENGEQRSESALA